MSTNILTIVIVLAFLIIFPLFWSAIIFMVSRFAWAGYAEEFATHKGRPDGGEVARFQNIRFGSLASIAQYGNAVTVAATDKGLFLAPSIFLLRPGHRDLLIPWSKIDKIEQANVLGFAVNSVEVRGGYKTIRIYRKIGQAVRKRWEAEKNRKART